MAKDDPLLKRLLWILSGAPAKPVDPPPSPPVTASGASVEVVHSTLDPVETKPVRQAVLLVRGALPVPDDEPAKSYIGGLPRMPAHFEWPTETPFDEPRALTFVAQIDLGELPAFADRELLPAAGTLYFFVSSDFDGVGEPPCQVLHYDGDALTLPVVAAPDNLMTLAGDLYYYSRFWLDEERDLRAKVEFRYPLSFVVTESYPEDDEASQLDAWQKALGASSDHDLSKRYDLISPDDTAWPFNWVAVEHIARALRCKIERDGDRLKAVSADGQASLAAVVAGASSWVTRAAAADSFAAPSSADAQEFRSWWRAQRVGLDELIRQYKLYHLEPDRAFRVAVDYAVRLTCAAGGAARELIPAHYLECVQTEVLWQRPTTRGLSVNMPMHQMFGYAERVQNAAADHAEDVLLLQIKGDPGLAWNENVGCGLQMWVARDALRAWRLSDVQATLECD